MCAQGYNKPVKCIQLWKKWRVSWIPWVKDLPQDLPWCCSSVQSEFHDFKHSAKLNSHCSSRRSETLVSTLRSSISDSNWRHSWWNEACGSVSECACSWVTWLKSGDSSEDFGDIRGMKCPYEFSSFTLRPSLCHSSKKRKELGNTVISIRLCYYNHNVDEMKVPVVISVSGEDLTCEQELL